MAMSRMQTPNRLRVFFDADVLFAAAASPSESGASHVLLQLAEITLIDGICSEQVFAEAGRNLETKLPNALSPFQMIVHRSLRITADPHPSRVRSLKGAAHWKDLPILVAAADAQCAYLVTFNTRHFEPGLAEVNVLRPGRLVMLVREHLVHLA
jgi:hypothetical protein